MRIVARPPERCDVVTPVVKEENSFGRDPDLQLALVEVEQGGHTVLLRPVWDAPEKGVRRRRSRKGLTDELLLGFVRNASADDCGEARGAGSFGQLQQGCGLPVRASSICRVVDPRDSLRPWALALVCPLRRGQGPVVIVDA